MTTSNANIGRNSVRIHRHKEDSMMFVKGEWTDPVIVCLVTESSSV